MKAENIDLHRISIYDFAHLPLHERVLDRLADLLIEAEELLDLLNRADARDLGWIEPHIRNVYDEVDAVMRRLCD